MADIVRLENVAAFRRVLRDYRMSAHAKQVLDQSRLVVLAGVAGGGRNSVINYLVEHDNYYFLVSDTTRPPKLRDGRMEQNGVNYYFRSEADMLREIQAGEFIEAEIIHNQQVSGTSIRELERANQSGRIAIHDVEFGGARAIAMAKPDALVIGLLPPSYDEWLRRLQGREHMHKQEFRNRLKTAEKVLEQMLEQPYFIYVVNNTIKQCAADIRLLVDKGQTDTPRQQAARQVAEEMLHRVRQEIHT